MHSLPRKQGPMQTHHGLIQSGALWSHLSANPFDAICQNSLFVQAFENFVVIMPSPHEITVCDGALYPNPLYMPAVVRGRGRLLVKRLKRKVIRLRKTMKATAGGDVDERARHCSICCAVSHTMRTCLVQDKFKARPV